MSHGCFDQRLVTGGGSLGSKAIFSFFEPILGQMEPLLNNKQLKGLISDQVEKKIVIILKIGRVIAIFFI